MSEIDPKLSRLYREASNEAPPAALDTAILAAAREHAAQARRRAGSRSWWRNWMAPASAVATLALGVSLALLIERERPEIMDDTSSSPATAQTQSAPPARTGETATAQAADSAAPATAAQKKDASAPLRPAPAAAAPRTEPAPFAAQAFPAERRDKAAAPRMSAPNAAMESNLAGDAATGALGAATPAAPAAAARLVPLRQQAAPRPAEAWLEEIVRLKRDGREKEAAEQLAEFRKAYPAYALPQDLSSDPK